ncbi:MAG: DUF6627 family protein [Thioalkalivibrio sp.]
MFKNPLVRRILVLLCLFSLLGGALSPAIAGMVGTGDLLATEQSLADRDRLLAALDRDDVRDQLTILGVDPSQAADRVARMTDAEVVALNERLDEMPAGAGILGVLVVVFIVLVVTDVIGATDIFPFIRPVN